MTAIYLPLSDEEMENLSTAFTQLLLIKARISCWVAGLQEQGNAEEVDLSVWRNKISPRFSELYQTLSRLCANADVYAQTIANRLKEDRAQPQCSAQTRAAIISYLAALKTLFWEARNPISAARQEVRKWTTLTEGGKSALSKELIQHKKADTAAVLADANLGSFTMSPQLFHTTDGTFDQTSKYQVLLYPNSRPLLALEEGWTISAGLNADLEDLVELYHTLEECLLSFETKIAELEQVFETSNAAPVFIAKNLDSIKAAQRWTKLRTISETMGRISMEIAQAVRVTDSVS